MMNSNAIGRGEKKQRRKIRMKLTRGNNKKEISGRGREKGDTGGCGGGVAGGWQDKGRMRRREGEGLWRDMGEGAEERRGERAGMRGGGGNNGERPIRWLIGKKKRNNGDAGVQVSAGRDVLLFLEIPSRWSETL